MPYTFFVCYPLYIPLLCSTYRTPNRPSRSTTPRASRGICPLLLHTLPPLSAHTHTITPRVNYYDKDLFTGVAANVSANFTKFETEQLLKLLSAFHTFNHYDQAAFDDVADSITYCNHYLAPIKACPTQLATAFAAYAKHDHVRGDLFNTLARCAGDGRIQWPELWNGCCTGGYA